MARKHPQSEGGCNRTILNVSNDIVDEGLRPQEVYATDSRTIARSPRGDDFNSGNSSPDAGHEKIDSCIEQPTIVEFNNLVGMNAPTPRRSSFSVQRCQRRQMAVVRRKTSISSHDKYSDQLCTLVNVLTSDVSGKVVLSTLPSLHALLGLDEMSMDENY